MLPLLRNSRIRLLKSFSNGTGFSTNKFRFKLIDYVMYCNFTDSGVAIRTFFTPLLL